MLQYLQEQNQTPSRMITNESIRNQPQPMNTIRVDQTGEYLTPQGTRSQEPVQFESARPIQLSGGRTGYLDRQGNVTFDTDQGQMSTTLAQIKQNDAEQRYRQQIADMPRQKQMADLQKTQAEAEKLRAEAGGGVKPQFSADAGGYIYPPSQDFPQGRFVRPEGMPTGGSVGKTTEDQAKAAGWYNQAQNAYANLTKSMIDPSTGKISYKAASPSMMESMLPKNMKGAVQSPERQRFAQAASSMSEALLRAATGAGVNKEEAEQKIAELTPTYWDDDSTKKQKLAAIPMYLQSLQTRAGKAPLIEPSINGMDLPDSMASSKPAKPAAPFDSDKEARYQAWKAQRGQ